MITTVYTCDHFCALPGSTWRRREGEDNCQGRVPDGGRFYQARWEIRLGPHEVDRGNHHFCRLCLVAFLEQTAEFLTRQSDQRTDVPFIVTLNIEERLASQ